MPPLWSASKTISIGSQPVVTQMASSNRSSMTYSLLVLGFQPTMARSARSVASHAVPTPLTVSVNCSWLIQ